MIMADLSWEQINIFRGDTRSLCSQSTQRTNLVITLNLFAQPLRVEYGWPFVNVTKFKKDICSHSTEHICIQGISFRFSNCIFMQLQGKLFIQLQGNDMLVNFQGKIFFQRTYIYSQKYIR